MFYKIMNVVIYGIPHTYVFKSLINPTSFVGLWFSIHKLQGTSLGLSNLNFVFSY
jgi:hypothetical protein